MIKHIDILFINSKQCAVKLFNDGCEKIDLRCVHIFYDYGISRFY